MKSMPGGKHSNEQAQSENSAASSKSVAAILRRVLPDIYFVNATHERMARHVEFLQRLPQEELIFDFQARPGQGLSELTLCAYDDREPGFMSKFYGTLAALRVNVQTAFIFTVRAPVQSGERAEKDERWIVLDTFLLSETQRGHERALSEKTTQRVRRDLSSVLRNEETVAHLLSKSRLRPHATGRIEEITFENRVPEGLTMITVRGEDHVGLLHRTTTAMARLDLNIRSAQISTHDGLARNVFFVTDARFKPLPETKLAATASRLRSMLQEGATFGLSSER